MGIRVILAGIISLPHCPISSALREKVWLSPIGADWCFVPREAPRAVMASAAKQSRPRRAVLDCFAARSSQWRSGDES